MDATSLHIQTSKANKAEVGEKIKVCLFSHTLQVSDRECFHGEARCYLWFLHGRNYTEYGNYAPR